MINNSLALMKELTIVILLLPLGAIIGAATERFCRLQDSHARLHNSAVKVAVAYVSAFFILRKSISFDIFGSTMQSHHEYSGPLHAAILTIRLVVFLSGVIVGTVLQPVGLTGGIATGKSTVSKLFSESDTVNGCDPGDTEFVIIDVDGIAHDILLPDKFGADSVYHRLIDEFGEGILRTEEKEITQASEESRIKRNPPIDRRKLGDIVFRDSQKRRKLNSITHPKIIKIMIHQIIMEGLNFTCFSRGKYKQQSPKKKRRVVCVDIPLLFEGGIPMRFLFGTVVVVACSPKLQLQRLQKRNTDLSLEQCKQRIASQIPIEEKARRANVVIQNNSDFDQLKSEVRKVKSEIANIVVGKQRGIELSWLVVGMGILMLLVK
mmetsp:Transcript_22492/g.45679  ORF Transcript_22492/g.45679 Transcript_22492/m.45679 type:complete len:378 (+) Transcript_22492:202-1335(+)